MTVLILSQPIIEYILDDINFTIRLLDDELIFT